MPGTTPVYGFPYLTGTDGGKQIKTVSEALALALEATLANTGQVPLDADLVSLMQRLAALEAPGETATDGIVSLASSNFTLISQEGFRKGGRAQVFVLLQRAGDGAVNFATAGAGWFLNLLPGWEASHRASGHGVASMTDTLLAGTNITGTVPVTISRIADQRVDYMRPGVGSLPLNGYFGIYLDYALKTD